MGHCCYYSIEIFVVDYDSYHCLLLMLYVSGLATVDFVWGFMLLCFSRHYTLFLLCHILWFPRFVLFFIIGIHTIGYVRYYTIVAYAICVTVDLDGSAYVTLL